MYFPGMELIDISSLFEEKPESKQPTTEPEARERS